MPAEEFQVLDPIRVCFEFRVSIPINSSRIRTEALIVDHSNAYRGSFRNSDLLGSTIQICGSTIMA